jgi:hypothetical protein
MLYSISFTTSIAGVVGGARDDGARYVLFYDFNPAIGGPLLQREPELMVPADFFAAQGGKEQKTEINDIMI